MRLENTFACIGITCDCDVLVAGHDEHRLGNVSRCEGAGDSIDLPPSFRFIFYLEYT